MGSPREQAIAAACMMVIGAALIVLGAVSSVSVPDTGLAIGAVVIITGAFVVMAGLIGVAMASSRADKESDAAKTGQAENDDSWQERDRSAGQP